MQRSHARSRWRGAGFDSLHVGADLAVDGTDEGERELALGGERLLGEVEGASREPATSMPATGRGRPRVSCSVMSVQLRTTSTNAVEQVLGGSCGYRTSRLTSTVSTTEATTENTIMSRHPGQPPNGRICTRPGLIC
jgi:hypothetical protein